MLNDEYCNGCDLLLLACELLCTLSEGVKATCPQELASTQTATPAEVKMN